jgi:uncharacterized protein YcgI (DUF1989 family)
MNEIKTPSSSLPIQRFHIDAQSGIAFRVKQGQIIRIIDVEGEQVSDLYCFAESEIEEHLSSGHTTDYNGKLFLSKGDTLYSNQSNAMFTIVADLVGKHIMLYAPCSQEMFEMSYGVTEAHSNCLDNLVTHFKDSGIQASDIAIPFTMFMNIKISPQGIITILPPLSKAGDYIELKAEMNMIVGVTACSAGTCNNFEWTPIEVEIYLGDPN